MMRLGRRLRRWGLWVTAAALAAGLAVWVEHEREGIDEMAALAAAAPITRMLAAPCPITGFPADPRVTDHVQCLREELHEEVACCLSCCAACQGECDSG